SWSWLGVGAEGVVPEAPLAAGGALVEAAPPEQDNGGPLLAEPPVVGDRLGEGVQLLGGEVTLGGWRPALSGLAHFFAPRLAARFRRRRKAFHFMNRSGCSCCSSACRFLRRFFSPSGRGLAR